MEETAQHSPMVGLNWKVQKKMRSLTQPPWKGDLLLAKHVLLPQHSVITKLTGYLRFHTLSLCSNPNSISSQCPRRASHAEKVCLLTVHLPAAAASHIPVPQRIWLFWSVQVVVFFFFFSSSGISSKIALSCKLNKLIPAAETLKQRRWKPELTWEMLHCPPAQPLQLTEFNQLQLNLNKTSQPCCNAIAGLAKKSMYLVASSEKAQPSPRHSASHLFTRSTLQISNSIHVFFQLYIFH